VRGNIVKDRKALEEADRSDQVGEAEESVCYGIKKPQVRSDKAL
jgi:hypothetical protein